MLLTDLFLPLAEICWKLFRERINLQRHHLTPRRGAWQTGANLAPSASTWVDNAALYA